VGDGAHARHEFCYVDRMVERSALLALLLAQPPLPSTPGDASPTTETLDAPASTQTP
jgi:glutamate carboxypeptidase